MASRDRSTTGAATPDGAATNESEFKTASRRVLRFVEGEGVSTLYPLPNRRALDPLRQDLLIVLQRLARGLADAYPEWEL